MKSIDLTPLYRSSVGFDRLASLLDSAMATDNSINGYPPYDIEVLDDNRYTITLAVAGIEENEIDIKVEKGVLTVRGEKTKTENRRYLHQGIAHRSFERKFNLADYIEVTSAELHNGLLSIQLVKEIPEAMKPKTIPVTNKKAIQHEE